VTEEARLAPVDSGLTPATDGWFVVNVRDAAWLTNDKFGARCVFEANGRVVGDRSDLELQTFPQLGLMLDVIWPDQPSGLYHSETKQEDFLVLAGECVLLIDGEERRLRAWDFVHCPPGTDHIFVGAGDGPCVIFMTGARGEGKQLDYPVWEVARRYGAGVENKTSDPHEAYAPYSHWELGRPKDWDDLPWS
jgi:uncharacterized cupin superfamily protein